MRSGLVVGLICALIAPAIAQPVTEPTLDPEPAKAATSNAAASTKTAKVAKASKPSKASKAKRSKTKKKLVAKRRSSKRTSKTKRATKVAVTSPAPKRDTITGKPSPIANGDPTSSPAYRYGSMASDTCLAELASRKIAYRREGDTLGVVTPVRLLGPLRGIEFRTNQDAKQRATSRWEIADCRLVLALDDFAALLAKRDVVEVRHYSMYRQPDKGFSGREATRHPGGMALDAARFIRRDGTYLDVEDHYHGRIGQRSCGDDADPPSPATPEAIAIREILCEAASARLFNVVLTPNHDRPHHNHFHLEVTAGKQWFLVK